MKGSPMIFKWIAFSALFLLLMCDLTYAQPDYSIHISDIRVPDTKVKNWYGRPVENDFIVSWKIYTPDSNDGKLKLIDATGKMAYKVYLSKDSTFSTKDAYIITDADTALFAHIKSGMRYYFRVDGIDKLDSSNVVHSDVAWAIGGNKVLAMPELKDNECEIPLFFPVAELFDKMGWHSTIYFNSGNFGKLAFTLLWLIIIVSIGYVIPFRCMKSLDLGRIFPFSNMNPFKRNVSKEQSFDQFMAPRFRFVIEAWKRVITVTNNVALNNEDGENDASLETINKKFFDYFKMYGALALQVLKDVMDFNPQESDQSEKAELEKKIKEYFDEGAVFGGVFAKPHDVKSENDSAVLFWRDVENDLFSQSAKPINDYATVRILQAGLGNHIINGYHWQIVSEEVDRAIENRAASEYEQLKERASVDWLWNLGTLSPLLGLFGTVTGISGVFGQLGGTDPNMTQKELVDTLANGIFEALWTTIYGLMAAILLMILYYNFKNRLDWIYNRWQEIAVRITENL